MICQNLHVIMLQKEYLRILFFLMFTTLKTIGPVHQQQ